MTKTITSKGEVILWTGDKASWHFLVLDPSARKKVDAVKGPRRGWGQIKVKAILGKTIWETSIFPDKKSGWVLPLKAVVRKKEGIEKGSKIHVSLKLQL